MKTRCCCSKRYLLVFSILLVSVGSIFMSVSLSSCSSPSVKNPLLLCADSLMETCPDSALSILESITCPQKMPRTDRALYALLLTQARHKNYIALETFSLLFKKLRSTPKLSMRMVSHLMSGLPILFCQSPITGVLEAPIG